MDNRAVFDPEDTSNDDKLPATEADYFKWAGKYTCQMCRDCDGLDFNSSHEDHIRSRRYWIYRLPLMKNINGMRACPACSQRFERTLQRSITRTQQHLGLLNQKDAKATYKLSDTDMKKLEVKATSPNPINKNFATQKFYDRVECAILHMAKEAKKAEKAKKAKKDLGLLKKRMSSSKTRGRR